MSTTNTISVLDRFLDPLTDCLSPDVAQRIVGLKLDPKLQDRLDALAAKSSAGTLTVSERQEYEDYVESIDIVGVLKSKARQYLSRQSS